MKKHLFLLLSICITTTLYADDAKLLKRIETLEARIEQLETQLAPIIQQEADKQWVLELKETAFNRMMLDAEVYSRHDLELIEKLYQTAKADWKSEDAQKATALLIKRYPRANRTGIATLTRAQSIESNDEQLDLLKKATTLFHSCYYSNGVQVGPYAHLYLGMRLKNEGKDQAADEQFKVLKNSYPNAIDHHGKKLLTHLKDI